MTTSPYDNLPVSRDSSADKSHTTNETAGPKQYIEVPVDTRKSASAGTSQMQRPAAERPQSGDTGVSDGLTYIEVPPESIENMQADTGSTQDAAADVPTSSVRPQAKDQADSESDRLHDTERRNDKNSGRQNNRDAQVPENPEDDLSGQHGYISDGLTGTDKPSSSVANSAASKEHSEASDHHEKPLFPASQGAQDSRTEDSDTHITLPEAAGKDRRQEKPQEGGEDLPDEKTSADTVPDPSASGSGEHPDTDDTPAGSFYISNESPYSTGSKDTSPYSSALYSRHDSRSAKDDPAPDIIHMPPAPVENAPRYDRIIVKNLSTPESITVPFEETLLVPDTMPDIEKILFAECSVSISKPAGTMYDRNDTVSGNITVFTIYKPAGGSDMPVDVIRSSISFRTDKCCTDSSCTHFIPSVSVIRCTSETVNERKFTARGELRISCSTITEKELDTFRDAGNDGFVPLVKTLPVSDMLSRTEDQTEISQEINPREGSPFPEKILSTVINVVENHKQMTAGKLVINATVHSRIFYAGSDDGVTAVCELSNKTDFTQFIMPGSEPASELIQTDFDCGDLKISITDDGRFLLEGRVRTAVYIYENKELSMLCDAYHKKNDIIFGKHDQTLYTITEPVSGEISSREIVDLEKTDRKPSRLLYGTYCPARLTARPEKGRIVIEGSVMARILALDENDEPFVIENDIPLRGSLEMSRSAGAPDADQLTAEVTSGIRDFWFDEINNRQLEINVTVTMNVWVSCPGTFTMLDGFAVSADPSPARKVAMALYITSPGDTLWDVAKRYRTDISTLTAVNDINEGDSLTAGMKLLVAR